MAQSNPTHGALRAAEEISQNPSEGSPAEDYNTRIAEIIDRETGLPLLLSTCRELSDIVEQLRLSNADQINADSKMAERIEAALTYARDAIALATGQARF